MGDAEFSGLEGVRDLGVTRVLNNFNEWVTYRYMKQKYN